MAYYLKSGKNFNVTTKEAMDLHESLPPGNYTIKQNKMSGAFYLEQIDSFDISGKIYGDTTKKAQRILNTFMDRPNSTGVMLTGEKGSGKTLLAKMLAAKAAEMGHPTIVINAPWAGDDFNAFLQTIDQPCVILFDEFEKVYDRETQEHILTLLDGVFPSKKLFVLTCNDKWRVDSHMRNRPGRIYYMMDFVGLDVDFIAEYCRDKLDASEHIPTICKIATMFSQFNFDMLKALVEEMNRYDETPQEALKMLNAKPEYSDEGMYNVVLQPNGVDLEDGMADKQWHGNPMNKTIGIEYKKFDENPADSDPNEISIDREWDWETCRFTQEDLRQIDPKGSKFTFVNSDGDRLILSKVQQKQQYHWDAF